MAAKHSSLLAKRYAVSFFDLAQENKALKAVEQDMADLSAMLADSDDLKTLFHSLTISKDSQYAAIGAVAKKAGFHKLTTNFLNVLVQNRRTVAIEGIIQAFFEEAARRAGRVSVDVQVAQDLTAAQKKDLEAALKKSLGMDVNVTLRVEPGIMGGLIVTAGSYMVDYSVRRKLERLQIVMGGHSNQNFNAKQKEA